MLATLKTSTYVVVAVVVVGVVVVVIVVEVVVVVVAVVVGSQLLKYAGISPNLKLCGGCSCGGSCSRGGCCHSSCWCSCRFSAVEVCWQLSKLQLMWWL